MNERQTSLHFPDVEESAEEGAEYTTGTDDYERDEG